MVSHDQAHLMVTKQDGLNQQDSNWIPRQTVFDQQHLNLFLEFDCESKSRCHNWFVM